MNVLLGWKSRCEHLEQSTLGETVNGRLVNSRKALALEHLAVHLMLVQTAFLLAKDDAG